MQSFSNVSRFFPYLIYIVLIGFIFSFRSQLDQSGPYVTSDGAIKLYQSFQYKESGPFSLECVYPAKEIDPSYSYYPIHYPWAIFHAEGLPCVLEYPPFFLWIGTFVWKLFSLQAVFWIPLFFYAAAILFLDWVFRGWNLHGSLRAFLVLLSFFSFPLVTAIDYTENPLFILLYLIGYFFLFRTEEEGTSIKTFFLSGLFLGLAFVLRLEILIPFVLLFAFSFTYHKNIKFSFWMGVGFTIPALFLFFYNFSVSGHILGFRYVSSIQDNENASAGLLLRFQLLKAYLFGDSVMVGILRFQPFVGVMLVTFASLYRTLYRHKFIFIGITAAVGSMILIPLTVTFYGGVGYFGLRYLEPSFFLLILSFGFLLSREDLSKRKIPAYLLFISIIVSFYFNYHSTKEGLKILRNSAKEMGILQTWLGKSENYVVHSSLYTSIFMGRSFLDKKHVQLTGNTEGNSFLEKVPAKENLVFLLSPDSIYISPDIPKKIHPRFQTPLYLNKLPLKIKEEMKLNGITIVFAEKI